MQYVRLGNTGLKVSRICLGMMTYGDPKWRDWVLGIDAARPIVTRAAELGITFYDKKTIVTTLTKGSSAVPPGAAVAQAYALAALLPA